MSLLKTLFFALLGLFLATQLSCSPDHSPSILCPANNEEYQKLKESRYNELLFVRETLTDQLYSVLYR